MKPIPSEHGFGFCCDKPLENNPGYLYSQTGNFHNYFFTKNCSLWPENVHPKINVLDGFSPNLNKQLHSGHLKNLAVASAIDKICCKKSVAMLGATLGIIPDSLENYKKWCELANYHPEIYYDNQLNKPDIILEDGTGEYLGCKVWQGVNGPVVVYKSNGSSTYALHDISFAQQVSPTHYLTGAEQKEHFQNLGLGDKHLSLGLLLGQDNKKMASSTGEPIMAIELFNMVKNALKENPSPEKLTWNILACQFNMSDKSRNTKFMLDQWIKPEAPGMYITYTYARINKALKLAGEVKPQSIGENMELHAHSSYFAYYYNRAQKELAPHHIAQYAFSLSKVLSKYYNSKKIIGANDEFIYAISRCCTKLKKCIELLSMYPLEEV